MSVSKSINIKSRKWGKRRNMKVLRRLTKNFSPYYKAAIMGRDKR